MAGYPSDSPVVVHPFSHQLDGDTVVIGDLDRQVFLSIPPEGLDILQVLAAGHTVGEAVRRYEQRYGETPDIDDFLDTLAEDGFVEAHSEGPTATAADHPPATATADPASTTATADPAPATADLPSGPTANRRTRARPATIRWSSHLGWLSEETCRRLVSTPVLVVLGLVTAGGVGLIVTDPGVLPPPTVLVFRENFSLYVWMVVAVMLAGIMIHEFAHVVAARAAGIPARIGIGNRLYIVVIETDMSGIWLAPRRARYLAFLSGPLVDCAGAALIVLLLFAIRQGAVDLAPTTIQLIQAFLWTYLGRLMWQCFFFLRTDFYYVFASLTGCKDLKADTENFLRNVLRTVTRIGARIDQSAIPRRELRAIRGYSGLFLLGNAITIAALIFVTLPILAGYGVEIVRLLTGQPTPFQTVDFITLLILTAMLDVFGIYLWMRALHRGHRQRRARRERRDSIRAPKQTEPAAPARPG